MVVGCFVPKRTGSDRKVWMVEDKLAAVWDHEPPLSRVIAN